MGLTDADLLKFDAKRLEDFDRKKAEETLRGEHGDVYRAQLVAALWIDFWREGLVSNNLPGYEPAWLEGFEEGMREVAAHLRQGDLIPGGIFYEQTMRGDSVL
jgi:hypothetical protein